MLAGVRHVKLGWDRLVSLGRVIGVRLCQVRGVRLG